jgi:radical SAM enzyme (TIGR01210 family)
MEPTLQVAMGLETVDPSVLSLLNKRMTTDDFARAAGFLGDHGIGVRAFILLRAPFQNEEEGVHWANRSIEFAFSTGVECCSIVPTRTGNGGMEWLQEHNQFQPPTMRSVERVLEFGIGLGRGRVFMDLWDIERFVSCSKCGPARIARLPEINFSQTIPTQIACDCGT